MLSTSLSGLCRSELSLQCDWHWRAGATVRLRICVYIGEQQTVGFGSLTLAV